MPIERLQPMILILILFFISSVLCQECPEIYVPPYGAKPLDCGTSIGSTCLITCPDDFDIIGACFRTCVLNDPATQQIDDNTDLKLAKNKKRPMTVLTVTRPFLYGLKPKRISFLPATSINKMVENQIRTGRKASCCNKTYREPRKELATLVGVTKKSNYHDFETCPGHSLPEHHLLQSLAKKMRQQEEDISGRQNTPRWSGYQPYCVNLDVQCEELSQPRNGFFYYCYNYAGLSCAVGCQSGYRLIGSRVLLCTRQGTWSDALPTCQQI